MQKFLDVLRELMQKFPDVLRDVLQSSCSSNF